MNIQIVMSGEPSLSFAKEGIAEYIKRCSRFGSVSLISIKEDKHYLKKLTKTLEGSDVILCDENGKTYSTAALSKKIHTKIQESTKTLSFVIGPPDGHGQEMRKKYGQTLSLSELTLPHDLAVLVLSEAIYRSLTILDGHPYHRS